MKRSNRFIEGGKAVDTGVADQQPSQLTKPELYVALGKCARLQGQTGSLMRSLVEELRDRGVKLQKARH
jgi:hypothetical protein